MPSSHTPAHCLECWFDFASSYSYLSIMRIEAQVQQAGLAIAWKPFLLGPIFRSHGLQTSPFLLHPEKERYMWRDIERRAAQYGLPFHKPSVFPQASLLPGRVALVGTNEPWIGAFCRTVMLQNFSQDLDISDPGHVRSALQGLVPDPDALIQAAQSDANKTRLREQTATAQQRGIFGAPTFFVGDEMFWGDDRLDDAIAWAARSVTR